MIHIQDILQPSTTTLSNSIQLYIFESPTNTLSFQWQWQVTGSEAWNVCSRPANSWNNWAKLGRNGFHCSFSNRKEWDSSVLVTAATAGLGTRGPGESHPKINKWGTQKPLLENWLYAVFPGVSNRSCQMGLRSAWLPGQHPDNAAAQLCKLYFTCLTVSCWAVGCNFPHLQLAVAFTLTCIWQCELCQRCFTSWKIIMKKPVR